MRNVQKETEPERLSYTVQGFCEATGLGTSKTYQLIAEGRLRTVKVGKRRLILAESVRALLREAADAAA